MNVPQHDLNAPVPRFGWMHDTNERCLDTIMRCPNGHISSLRDHSIAPDGTVTPSTQCPKCEFHENVVLSNYHPHPHKMNWSNIHAEYVNLDKRADRRARMEKDLARAGIPAVRRRGMLPEEYKGTPASIQAMWDRPQKGAIGCHFSQQAVMLEALRRGKHALVMEDDLVFCSDFQARMDEAMVFLDGHEWDILWLGGTFHINPPHWHAKNKPKTGCRPLGQDALCVPTWPRMMRTFGCFCTYAYLVNGESIHRIVNMMQKRLSLSIGIDHMMIMLQPNLWTFAYVPGMVKQYDHVSDIGTDAQGRPGGMTIFSNFAKLNGSLENSAYWWQDKRSDFVPEKFNWHEASSIT